MSTFASQPPLLEEFSSRFRASDALGWFNSSWLGGEHLVETVGTGDEFAKSEDRYKQFIDSGLPLAKAFAGCWEHMRTETGALAGSVFEPAAKDAPGQPPAEDIPQHHTGKLLVQRFCTRARMRLRHAGVVRRSMALLPHDEALREAFDLDIPSDFFITIPDARLKCSSLDVPTVVAC